MVLFYLEDTSVDRFDKKARSILMRVRLGAKFPFIIKETFVNAEWRSETRLFMKHLNLAERIIHYPIVVSLFAFATFMWAASGLINKHWHFRTKAYVEHRTILDEIYNSGDDQHVFWD